MTIERNPNVEWAFGFVVAREGCYMAFWVWTISLWGEP